LPLRLLKLSALKITSFFAPDAIKVLCTENGIFKTPSQDEIELAHKFENFYQVNALEMLGKEHAETALKITSEYALDALKIICTENGILRKPTEDEIILANKFVDNDRLDILKSLGKEHAETALKITSDSAANALKFICTENEMLRKPTQDEIELANKFDFDQFNALIKRGKEHAETASKVISLIALGALEILCTENGLFRTPTEDEITLANKFDDFDSFYALKDLGKEHAETASKITSFNALRILKIRCTENGVFRKPTEDEITSANKFDNYDQLSALKSLNEEQAETALKITSNIIGNALEFFTTENDECRTPSEDIISLANKFFNPHQLYALKSLEKEHAETALKITSIFAPSALQILATENKVFRTPTEEEIQVANKFVNGDQIHALTILGDEHVVTALKMTSGIASEALKILCTENGIFRTPTEDEIEIANKFDNYDQVIALKDLGKEHAETALKLSFHYPPMVLKILCNENGIFRTPTDDEIEIANKFDNYEQYYALTKLGYTHAKTALKITSIFAPEVLKILATENGVFRAPTEDEIEIAHKFHSYAQVNALEILSKEYVETILKITSNYAPNVLKFLCMENGVFKIPAQEEIELANKFFNIEQFYALTRFGKDHSDVALKITSYHAADALKILCVEHGVFRTPIQDEINLANKFYNYHQVAALERLGKEHAETALKITYNPAADDLKFLRLENGVLIPPTESEIDLAKKFETDKKLHLLESFKNEDTLLQREIIDFTVANPIEILLNKKHPCGYREDAECKDLGLYTLMAYPSFIQNHTCNDFWE
jgi:hypothetical protein